MRNSSSSSYLFFNLRERCQLSPATYQGDSQSWSVRLDRFCITGSLADDFGASFGLDL